MRIIKCEFQLFWFYLCTVNGLGFDNRYYFFTTNTIIFMVKGALRGRFSCHENLNEIELKQWMQFLKLNIFYFKQQTHVPLKLRHFFTFKNSVKNVCLMHNIYSLLTKMQMLIAHNYRLSLPFSEVHSIIISITLHCRLVCNYSHIQLQMYVNGLFVVIAQIFVVRQRQRPSIVSARIQKVM